jgi:hypothetical protein
MYIRDEANQSPIPPYVNRVVRTANKVSVLGFICMTMNNE